MAAAQEQHRSIVDAIRNREGKRAEALGCEHSRSAWQYLRIVLDAASPRSFSRIQLDTQAHRLMHLIGRRSPVVRSS
jgi:hypothetical protein